MQVSGCPRQEELAAFALGELPADDVDRLADHLADCAACAAKLAALDDLTGDVVSALRRGGGPSPAPAAARPDVGVVGRAGTDPNPFGFTPATPSARDDDVVAAALTADYAPPPAPPQPEGVGSRIGSYRLLQLLGEGGFGSVYLADQERPVRRQVAVKLVKLGMDTRQVLARFSAERQALALMDHPNIARVYDAGTTDRGSPYFVMELAKGPPITEYCDTHLLPPRRRLELFVKVCEAVQHAHTKGVIHRDIKPSNVLVTVRDGKPAPKVIDFGIAKAIGGRLADQTLYTEAHQFIGTPQYMSPEQADGATLDVDARADVYSLGVLLYELLTGTTPFDTKALMAKGADAVRKALRETDAPKPSTRVGALPSREAVAAKRGTEARRLTQSLKGELDWIAMKCLEKDRAQRYETANALAMDVRRHLNDEPVRACPPGAAYHVRKFVRRHRAGVAAAAGVVAAMLLGTALAVRATVEATEQRNAAVDSEVKAKRERVQADEARASADRAKAAADTALVARDAAEQARQRDLRSADRARRMDLARSVPAASAAGAITLIDRLARELSTDAGRPDREPVLALFRELARTPEESVARSRAACALCLLGQPLELELTGSFAAAPATEGRLILSALAAAAERESAARVAAPAATVPTTGGTGGRQVSAVEGAMFNLSEQVAYATGARFEAGARARAESGRLVDRLYAAAVAQNNRRVRARYAITLLGLGDDREAARALGPAPDPADGAAFVAEFAQWHGDLTGIGAVLDRVSDDVRRGLCLAVGQVDPRALEDDGERAAAVAALRRQWAKTRSAGVRAAADHALRAWGVTPAASAADETERLARPRAEFGWFVNRSGLAMARVPAGFNVLGDGRDGGAPATPVLFTRPWFASAAEVPVGLFKAFVDDPAVESADKPAGWSPRPANAAVEGRSALQNFLDPTTKVDPSAPATGLSFREAARFCNWLSDREGRRPAYVRSPGEPAGWRPDPSADGYRLPTQPEWEYAARAGGGTRYACCDDAAYLTDFADVALAGSNRRGAPGGRGQPNRWGLSATAGGAWEMCWDADPAAEPFRAGLPGDPPGPFPAVDPRPAASGGRGAMVVGGGTDSGTADLRVAGFRVDPFDRRDPTVGFRVVCAAPVGGSPPRPVTPAVGVPVALSGSAGSSIAGGGRDNAAGDNDEAPRLVPDDAGELWVWAGRLRPGDPALRDRATQNAGRLSEARYRQGLDLGKQGRWKESADAFARIIDLRPEEPRPWSYLATLRLELGDATGYDQACRRLSELAADTRSPGSKDRAAKAMLVDPDLAPGPRLDLAAEHARWALHNDWTKSKSQCWFLLDNGMAEYRAGRFAPALGYLADSTNAAPDKPTCVALGTLFRAMALAKSGKPDEARVALKAATDAIQQHAPANAETLSDEWPDWLICRIVRREAERVVGDGR